MGAADYPHLFVTPDWLAGHLGGERGKIVDGSWHMPAAGRNARSEYDAKHIPGAVFFDIDAIADTSSGLPHMLPAPEDFATATGALGLREDDAIIVYDTLGLFSAARVWWSLSVMGATNVRILAGGLPAWEAAGLPVAAAEETPAPAVFTPVFNKRRVVDFDDVCHEIRHGTAQILDARPHGRFEGRDPEPRAGLKSGHMPGAACLPASELIEDGALIAPDRLGLMLAAAGVTPERPVITSCGSGVTAAIISLALEAIGHDDTALYDGSWTDWASRADAAIVTDQGSHH